MFKIETRHIGKSLKLIEIDLALLLEKENCLSINECNVMKPKLSKATSVKKVSSQAMGQSLKDFLIESLTIEIPQIKILPRIKRSLQLLLMKASRPKFFDVVLVPLLVSFIAFVAFLILVYLTHFNK